MNFFKLDEQTVYPASNTIADMNGSTNALNGTLNSHTPDAAWTIALEDFSLDEPLANSASTRSEDIIAL
jgi:hypothetical protein